MSTYKPEKMHLQEMRAASADSIKPGWNGKTGVDGKKYKPQLKDLQDSLTRRGWPIRVKFPRTVQLCIEVLVRTPHPETPGYVMQEMTYTESIDGHGEFFVAGVA